MQTVIEQEKDICQKLNRSDPCALKALDDLFVRFELDDHMRPPSIRSSSEPCLSNRSARNGGN